MRDVYDKAKYHATDVVRNLGLPASSARVPTGLMFGWLAARGLLAPWLAEEVGSDAQRIRDGLLTGPAAWGRVGGVLTRDGVSDHVRELVDWLYFGDERLWMTYLATELAANLTSLYHIPDSAVSQALASEFLDEVYEEWLRL